jgi:N-acetylated-alpha-linked acidic dipeptidase
MRDGDVDLGPASLRSLNAKLIQSERKLTTAGGLPRRPWYKHAIYAPGFYTGYGVKTIPGVREAIEQKQWEEAERQIAIAASVLEDEAALIDATATELEEAK